MQYSKKVTDLARQYNVNGKDVLFALLVSAGASMAESYAVIHRTSATTNAGISQRATKYITEKPAIKRLIDDLDSEKRTEDETAQARRGRPRKQKDEPNEDAPSLDYTDKDAVLKELAKIAERAENENVRLSAIEKIATLQRMKQEAAVEDEKRVTYFLPMDDATSSELLAYLRRYYAEKDVQKADS